MVKETEELLLTFNTDLFTDMLKDEVNKQYKNYEKISVRMMGKYKTEFKNWLTDSFNDVEEDEENKGFYRLK